ncbi:hypothetical protein AKJ16_DCAP22731 [Drosera capensis]
MLLVSGMNYAVDLHGLAYPSHFCKGIKERKREKDRRLQKGDEEEYKQSGVSFQHQTFSSSTTKKVVFFF